MALTYQAFFQNEVEKLIQFEILRLKDSLVSAHTSFDFVAYKHQVGIIVGLQRALELVEDAESVVNGGDNQRG
jgi:hypothetical protein